MCAVSVAYWISGGVVDVNNRGLASRLLDLKEMGKSKDLGRMFAGDRNKSVNT